MGSNSTSSETQPSTPATPVQPQTVQDPLHTGLSQNLQDTTTPSHDTQGQPTTIPTTPLPTTDCNDAEQLYSGFVEDEMLRSSELITAAYTTMGRKRPDVPTWQTLSTTTNSTAIRELLTALAFNAETTDSWNVLGLSRLEGPKPTIHLLQSRRDVAFKLVDSCTQFLHDAAQREMQGIKQHIGNASNECCNNLESNLRERKLLKGSSRNVPRWMEPSEELHTYLAAQTQPHGRLALHLSNLKKVDIAKQHWAVDVDTCRQLHSHLCGPPDEIERTLTRWGDQTLLTWAPIDNGQLLKVAAAVRKIHHTTAGQAQLTLAVPFDPYPACDSITDITDIWDHPLLHTKWQDVVTNVTLLTPPTRIVVSGAHAPIHTMKCIGLFTLGHASTRAQPQLSTWRLNFFKFEAGPIFIVDVPAQFRHTTKSMLIAMGLPAVQTIDNPRPSLGATPDQPRSAIRVHLEPGKLTPLHTEALLGWLSNALKDVQAIVGVLNTMSSPTAMLLDCMSATAGRTHADLCWSTLVISPKLLLVETRTDATTWTTHLTDAWNRHPTSAGIKVRYRPSANVKPTFAQVEATTSDIAAVRARKGHSPTTPTLRNPTTLQATISMPLGTCGPLDQWLPIFMQRVAAVNNLPLQRCTSESGLDIYKWKAVMAYDNTWTGKIIVQLRDPQELQHVYNSLHGQGIEVQHHVTGIMVESAHVDLRPSPTQSS